MKICVTSEGKTLDSRVDARFGRCRYFIIVDPESLEFEALENPNTELSGGAGVGSGQFMSEKKVEVVLTGQVGPNAFVTLNSAGIEVYTGVSGTVKEALDNYKMKRLNKAEKPSVNSKFGMKGG
ncbi:MAG: dinitrogenase iron-molybdenum cofactor biosynthesis protein [Spirochaetes bacterium DG_61]|jgi:predicted Fe-Mo cluster-binding NifX family protein|nr:MAG: dinitrogenase iron-molybdenum cofactor biosynthesis protein [Spirochaetes bacterium DG_61]